jgi:predicted metalloendopeptidase
MFIVTGLCAAACSRRPPAAPAAADPGLACTDFYRYANRAWLASAEIPADEERWGVREDMRRRTGDKLHAILESLRAAPQPPGSLEAKLGVFYGTCMDVRRADSDGAGPLQSQLVRIDAIDARDDLVPEIGRLHQEGIPALFGFTAAQDPRRSTDVIAEAGAWSVEGDTTDILGLPDRDAYLRAGADAERLRAEYVAHIARTLALSGLTRPEASARAARVLAFETALASAAMTVAERQDPVALQHPMTRAELAAATPGWSWPRYFASIGRSDIQIVNLTEPRYFAAISDLLRHAPLDDWKAYLRWRVAARAAPDLGSAFVDEDFQFSAVLGGAREPLPRWRSCIAITDELLGEALGRLYVEREFPPAAKQRANALAHSVIATVRDELTTLPWMTEPTRRQALAKLDAFVITMGYPDAWRDYTALAVQPGPFWSNVLSARRFETAHQLAKIGRPVDRNEWLQSPYAVDGHFDERLNRANIAAGLLQPPYFDIAGDDAANYATIGTTVAHELIHGFDARGRKFDGWGNLRDWWAPADEEQYLRQAGLVVDQYGRFVPIDDLHIDGARTLSENLADVFGVKLAYAAMKRALRNQPQTAIGGATPDQRFFVAYARAWAAVYRPEYLRQLLRTNTHSPAAWRVIGPLEDLPEFAAAFGCGPGSPMVRPAELRPKLF